MNIIKDFEQSYQGVLPKTTTRSRMSDCSGPEGQLTMTKSGLQAVSQKAHTWKQRVLAPTQS